MGTHYKAADRERMKEDYLKAYEQSLGLQYTSARRIGVSQQTINDWRKKYPDFDEAIREIDEKVAEDVVGILMKKIMDGDKASLFFWLKCRRGWSETHKYEVQTTNEIDIAAEIANMKKELLNEDA